MAHTMPLLAEKSSPVESSELLPVAEALAEKHLSSLDEFLESLSLLADSAGALIAGALAAVGIDLDLGLDTTKTSFNPREHQEVRLTFKRSDDGTCATDKAVPYTGELTDAFAFKPPDGYNGALPETEEQEEVFNSFLNDLDCDALDDEARLRLSYMKDDVEIGGEELELLAHDDNMYKMARDILEYRKENKLC